MVGNYDPKTIEPEILDFWEKNEIYKRIKERNKNNQKFTYLDGPPYTSGKIHLGHAWGKALRDSIMRYKRMQGFDVWDRAGFDMHGLPTENKVAAKFNFTRKEQIEEFGVEKFQKECENFCTENMNVMIKDFKRLGIWMDFDNPYMPIKREFIEGVWFLTKKAHEQNRLYEGHRVMAWCPSCATSLSKHELEYKNVTDKSIYVKLKLKDSDAYLVIWTTTPWTLPFNLGVMVNPGLKYIKIKINNELWIIAKERLDAFLADIKENKEAISIEEEFLGESLEGLKYEPLFKSEADIYEEFEKNYKNAFSVMLSKEYVDVSAGTGLVHSAPGCGPEDYEVGKAYGLPAFNETDQYGVFKEPMKELAGLEAKKDDSKFIELVRNKGLLVGESNITHEYAHCWRCKSPIIFRTTKQWFFKVEDLKSKMIKENKNIQWVPKSAFNAFESWLKNLKDNGITRQRYWGTPVPIWTCSNNQCNHIEVIGSIKELEEKAINKVPQNLHKPWIDNVKLKCPKCGSEMNRIKDIFDVWIDSGSAGWIAYDYPQREDLFKKYFPADLVLEGKDQIRGWFNLLMVTSIIALGKPSFKAVYMHSFINDYRGIKMSKSLGNIITPDEVIEQYGVDLLRYYTIGAANPGEDMNYNPDDPKTKQKNLMILWNLHKLLIDNIKAIDVKLDIDIGKKHRDKLKIEDLYILSKLNKTIKTVTEKFDNYLLSEIPWEIEEFYLELSRSYIQAIRERLNDDLDKITVLEVLSKTLFELIKIFAPIAPFVTEKIYLNLKQYLDLGKDSIHMYGWPGYDESFIDESIEESFKISEKIIQTALNLREKAKLGLRWPMPNITINTDKDTKQKIETVKDIIKNAVNAKELSFNIFEADRKLKPNYKALGAVFGKDTQKAARIIEGLDYNKAIDYEINLEGKKHKLIPEFYEIEEILPENIYTNTIDNIKIYINTALNDRLLMEGFAREITRRIQNERKEKGLSKTDLINIAIIIQEDLAGINDFKENIKKTINAKELFISTKEPEQEYIFKAEFSIKGKGIKILFDLVRE